MCACGDTLNPVGKWRACACEREAGRRRPAGCLFGRNELLVVPILEPHGSEPCGSGYALINLARKMGTSEQNIRVADCRLITKTVRRLYSYIIGTGPHRADPQQAKRHVQYGTGWTNAEASGRRGMPRFALLLRPGIRPRSSGLIRYMTLIHQGAKRVAQEMRTTRGTVVQAAMGVCCMARAAPSSGAVNPQTGRPRQFTNEIPVSPQGSNRRESGLNPTGRQEV
jgi:hypothetical protein